MTEKCVKAMAEKYVKFMSKLIKNLLLSLNHCAFFTLGFFILHNPMSP